MRLVNKELHTVLYKVSEYDSFCRLNELVAKTTNYSKYNAKIGGDQIND